ncbi:hypothetical protein KCP75_19745 [Salmonella enterica subsp. enterica]|nr:hypothetical protein KCP75_19745 [Salmonella enterica subsp. enterica]
MAAQRFEVQVTGFDRVIEVGRWKTLILRKVSARFYIYFLAPAETGNDTEFEAISTRFPEIAASDIKPTKIKIAGDEHYRASLLSN